MKTVMWKNKVYEFRLNHAARKIQKMVRKKFIAPYIELYKIIYSELKNGEQVRTWISDIFCNKKRMKMKSISSSLVNASDKFAEPIEEVGVRSHEKALVVWCYSLVSVLNGSQSGSDYMASHGGDYGFSCTGVPFWGDCVHEKDAADFIFDDF